MCWTGSCRRPYGDQSKKKHQTWVRVINDSEKDFIVTVKVISQRADSAFFVMNPPIRLLKKGSDERVGIIYTGQEAFQDKEYFLSVSFIPMNVSADKSVVLSQV
ncbi:fimbria/pilus periplasmic chaperone, partial [Escherichia coli]